MSTVANQIRSIVRDQLCLSPGEASDHDSLRQYGMDSLDAAEIILTVEDALGIEIDDSVMFKFDTVSQLVEAVDAVA